jgi:hypothetical protein
MPSIAFLEPIIDAAINSLQAELPAAIVAYNAEAGHVGALALVEPEEYVFGATDAMTVFPLVEVNVSEGTMGPFSLGDAGVGDADHDPRLNVVVWLQGTTGEVPDVYRNALGYARLVVEILCEDGRLGATAEVSGTRDDAIRYRFDVIPADPADVDREIRKWKVPAFVSFAVEAVETWA